MTTPASPEGYLGRPTQGQSLIHYLSTQDFHTCANLDKVSLNISIFCLSLDFNFMVYTDGTISFKKLKLSCPILNS